MTLPATGHSSAVRYKDPAFEQAMLALRRGALIGQPILLAFAGLPKLQLEAAARELAGKLGRPLVRLDLSRVTSKYIGETEKNLDRVLRAAEATGAVLLFDEADPLFGRRTEVKDSHDRYAHLEIGYLLTRLEQYRGLIVMTSNSSAEAHKSKGKFRQLAVRFPPR
jgi:SpoVK/Ycf46/Vps4 family AAA+-type ATPase